MTTEAKSREEAVGNLKAMMTEEAIAAHMREKHPGEPMMTKAQVDAQITKGVKVAAPAVA